MNHSRPRAFTLVEILLVLALMLLAGSILLPAAGALLPHRGDQDAGDAIADLFQQVRREAVLAGGEVTLRFDPGAQRFEWSGAAAGSREMTGTRLTVDVLRPDRTATVLIGGRMVETGSVPDLTFYPDGTCDPVRVQWRPAGGSARILAIDPWTCAPGLEAGS